MTFASIQTTADAAPFTSYAEGVGLFLVIGAGFLAACWLVDRYLITPYLRGRIDAALGRGDAQVRAGLNAEPVLTRFLVEGEPSIWRALAEYHDELRVPDGT